MNANDLTFGLQMTVVGMGVVFLLLSLLWLVLTVIGRSDPQPAVAAETVPEEAAAQDMASAESVPAAAPPQPTVHILADGLDADTVAAITIAVLTHADVRRRQAAPVMRTTQPGSLLYASRWVTMGRGLQNQAPTNRRR